MQKQMLYDANNDRDSANEYCEKVLDMDPENGEAYFYKLMADLNVSDDKKLMR